MHVCSTIRAGILYFGPFYKTFFMKKMLAIKHKSFFFIFHEIFLNILSKIILHQNFFDLYLFNFLRKTYQYTKLIYASDYSQ